MLKKFKLKITAVIVFASMFMTLIPTLGVFAEVPVSNADDYFKNLPTVTEDNVWYGNKVQDYTYGIGNAYAQDKYLAIVNSAPGSFKLTSVNQHKDNRAMTLALNFGMYDGTKEVKSYYGTNAVYSYAMDLNINFADTSSLSAGAGISDIDNTEKSSDGFNHDIRAHFILQGFGSGEIYLYQNGWKYDGNKVGNFTDLTDGKLENGSYTAVYTISMGKDLASSKGSWKLLKKDINGNVTQTIPLSQNITLKNSVEKSWGTVYYDSFGIKMGIDTPYKGSSIEITGARFYKESITEDASEALSQLPTLNGVRPDNANSQANMLGKLEFAGDTQCSFNTAPGKITVRAPYGASWVGVAHQNHINGVWFNFDDVAAAPNAGMYVYEADITTHNLGSLETSTYSSSVNNPSGNRMRWALVGSTVGINIYKDGFADNSNQQERKVKVEDGDIGSANLKLIGVLNIGNDTEKADLAIYYKKDGDPIKFAFSRTVNVSSLASISGSYLCLNAPIETEDKPVSMDITGAKFYKKDVSNSLSFNSVSYTTGDDGITVNAKYDYTRASDMNYTVIAAVYDAETNELASVNLQNVSVNASDYLEGTKDVSINLDYTGDMTGKNVKLFTWNSIEGMVPMFVSESVNNA